MQRAALFPSPLPEAAGRFVAVDRLREYLDRVGFVEIYKFIAGANLYAVTPSLITSRTGSDAARFFDTSLGDSKDLGILQCLMFGRPADRRSLSEYEQPLADVLVAAGLLLEEGRTLHAGPHQLISAFGLDLLIDRKIHFGGDVHDVYIGPDSFWMLYYMDTAAIRRDHRGVDLCTGSGIGALYQSLFCDRVVATDIGSIPLALVELNRRLNRLEDRVEVRCEDLRDTLDGRQRFDVLTCNPPFVAFPPGLETTLYAHGSGIDGLGYMRDIMERLPAVLTRSGSAYLVADLVGDREQPHFIAELHRFAEQGSLAVDVYIDNVVAAGAQVEPLAFYLAQLNPGRDPAEIARQIEQFQRSTLRADCYYMSTLKITLADHRPRVRLLRRYQVPRGSAAESWPAVLTRMP
jgi:hypothetical protein